MNKKIRKGNFVVENELRVGVFTIVQLSNGEGIKAVGISRKSTQDKENEQRGLSIARGRAEKALYLKLNKLSIRNIYMG